MLDDLRFEEVFGRTCCKQEITAVAAAVCLHPERVKELWNFAISTHPNAWRAMWALGYVNESHESFLVPYLHDVAEMTIATKHLGKKRELLKILLQHPLSADFSGELLDDCFNTIVSRDAPVGLRMYAMEMIAKFCEVYPELIPEYIAMLEDIVAEPPSVGMKGRALKLVKRFSS